MSCFDWEVEEMLNASREAIPPKGSRHGHAVEATGNFEMKIKFKPEEGKIRVKTFSKCSLRHSQLLSQL
jgi:hypothetical protein